MMELILVCLFLSLNIYQSFVSEGQLKSDEANVSKRKSETFMTSADFFHHLGGKTSKEVISWESFPTKLAGSDEKIFGQELFSLFLDDNLSKYFISGIHCFLYTVNI